MDVFQNGPTPILAPVFPDFTYPYEHFPAFPNLAYPYELFEDPSGMLSSQGIEPALNPSFLPYYNPVPSISSTQSTPPASDGAGPCAIYSVSTPLSPTPAPSQNATNCPSNWRKIPQTVYGLGKNRWDYQPSEPILFHVSGRPGVNMGDALRKEFTGLDGRDDPMFQDGVDAFSCRLVVRLMRQLPPPMRIDRPIQFPGYPVNSKPQVRTFTSVPCQALTMVEDFYKALG